MAKKRDAAALTKNEIREAEVTGYTAEGAGVVRVDGVPVFVPGAAQGDRLRVRIVKSLKSYAFGRIEEILSPSPDRIPEDCPVAHQCGGCVCRHISYEAELRAKEQRVRDALSRIGGFSGLPVLPILGAAGVGQLFVGALTYLMPAIRPSSPLVRTAGEASFSAFTLPTATASWRAKTACCSPRSLPARWRPCAGGRRRRAKQCTTREQGAAFCGICICEKALLPVR